MTTLFSRLSVALLFLAGLGGWSAFAQFSSGIEASPMTLRGRFSPGHRDHYRHTAGVAKTATSGLTVLPPPPIPNRRRLHEHPSRGGGTSISPNPDIVQSVNVRSNNFNAQKERNGGATVDVYTVPGSNQLHGTMNITSPTTAFCAYELSVASSLFLTEWMERNPRRTGR